MQGELRAMAELPAELASLVSQASEEQLDQAADGEWSARVILAHLRDEEALVFRLRLERMLSEDKPVFAPYPPDRWLAERDTSRDGLRQLLQDFALQRKASVTLMKLLDEEALQRRGIHPQRGEFTVSDWIRYWHGHDEEHRWQIKRALEIR